MNSETCHPDAGGKDPANESRLDILQRMKRAGHQELLNTDRQMITVRSRVRDDLK